RIAAGLAVDIPVDPRREAAQPVHDRVRDRWAQALRGLRAFAGNHPLVVGRQAAAALLAPRLALEPADAAHEAAASIFAQVAVHAHVDLPGRRAHPGHVGRAGLVAVALDELLAAAVGGGDVLVDARQVVEVAVVGAAAARWIIAARAVDALDRLL